MGFAKVSESGNPCLAPLPIPIIEPTGTVSRRSIPYQAWSGLFAGMAVAGWGGSEQLIRELAHIRAVLQFVNAVYRQPRPLRA